MHADSSDRLRNCPLIQVNFALDPEAQCMISEIVLKSFLRSDHPVLKSEIDRGVVCLGSIQPWTFCFVTTCVEARLLEGSRAEVNCAGKSNDQLTGIFFAATSFGHDWLVVPCLQAMDACVEPMEFVRDYYKVYVRALATSLFRSYFRSTLNTCLVFNALSKLPQGWINGLSRNLPNLFQDIQVATKGANKTLQQINEGPKDIYRLQPTNIPFEESVSFRVKEWVDSRANLAEAQSDGAGWDKKTNDSIEEYTQELDRAEYQRQVDPRGDDNQTDFQVMQAEVQDADDEFGADVPSAADFDNAWNDNATWSGIPATYEPVATASQRMDTASESAVANDGRTQADDGYHGLTAREVARATGVQDLFSANARDAFEARARMSWAAVQRVAPVDHAVGTGASIFGPVNPNMDHAPAGQVHTQAPYDGMPEHAPAGQVHTQVPYGMPDTAPSSQLATHTQVPFNGMPHPAPYTQAYPYRGRSSGFGSTVHVGHGVMHPTAAGDYGLAGHTMVARMNSPRMTSDLNGGTLYFRAGDIITNVVSWNPADKSSSLIFV